MNTKPLISVILPIYNIKNYLERCMEALSRQTYTNLEIVMVDDGSTDGCSELCDEYARNDKKIVCFHKENGGLSDARNYGIEHANGTYITCIDPDDYVDDDYIEYLYSLIVKWNTKMSICQHRVKYVNEKIKDHGSQGDERLEVKTCLERMLYHDVIDTSAWAKLYHQELFKTIRYPKGKLFEDIGTTYALMMECDGIAVGYESKYTYVIHKNSIVTGSFNPNKFDLVEMTDKMASDVLERYTDLDSAVMRRRIYARISTINQMLNVKGYDNERKELIDFAIQNKKAVLENPKSPKRDKVALMLLSFHYEIYKVCWLAYQRCVKGG